MKIAIIISGITIVSLITFILYLSYKVKKSNELVKWWHNEYTRDVPQLREDKSTLEENNKSLKTEKTKLEIELSRLRKNEILLEVEEINGEQKVYIYGNEIPFLKKYDISEWDKGYETHMKNIKIELYVPGEKIKSDESLKRIEVATEL